MLVRSVYSDAVWKCKCTFYSLFTCKQAIMMVTSSYSYDSWHIFGLKQSKTKVSQCLLRHPLFVIPLQTCTEIVLLMYRLFVYRNCTVYVPKLHRQNCHLPNVTSFVPKLTCTEIVHPLCQKCHVPIWTLPSCIPRR